MKLSILDHIVCPTCRSSFKLKIKSKSKNEVKEGTLICIKCSDKFKISKGIPRFVVDQTKDRKTFIETAIVNKLEIITNKDFVDSIIIGFMLDKEKLVIIN